MPSASRRNAPSPRSSTQGADFGQPLLRRRVEDDPVDRVLLESAQPSGSHVEGASTGGVAEPTHPESSAPITWSCASAKAPVPGSSRWISPAASGSRSVSPARHAGSAPFPLESGVAGAAIQLPGRPTTGRCRGLNAKLDLWRRASRRRQRPEKPAIARSRPTCPTSDQPTPRPADPSDRATGRVAWMVPNGGPWVTE